MLCASPLGKSRHKNSTGGEGGDYRGDNPEGRKRLPMRAFTQQKAAGEKGTAKGEKWVC